MSWKLTTLIENHQDPEGKLACEHGLSILIEGKDFRMLMDTGQTGAFLDNARAMDLSLEGLDCMLMSHAHYDHTGGFLRLYKEKLLPDKIYVGKHFFRRCYHQKSDGRMKFIGMKFDQATIRDLGLPVKILEENQLEIGPGVTLHRNFDRRISYEKLNLSFLYQEEELACEGPGRCMDSMNYKPDTFEDETVVTLETEDGLVVVAGCSHPGIVNILTTISSRTGKKICGVVGGTHLVEANEDRVRKTAEDFKRLGLDFVAVSHCTGDDNLAYLQESLGKDFIFNCTGNVISI